MDNLKDINEQILKLQNQRKQILAEKTRKNKEEFLKLDWISKCSGYLHIDHLSSVGIPRYRIHVNELFNQYDITSDDYIHIYGNSNFYQYNILYYFKGWNMNSPYFATSSEETLIRFLNTYKFKSIEFDKPLFSVLHTINQHYGQ